MATHVKHVGNYDGKKVVIAYKTIPSDPHSALVIPAERLNAYYHDELFKVVESPIGQESYELATVLAPKKFSDGNNMLFTLSKAGFLVKVPTEKVTVTPTPVKETWLSLSKLNEEIAKQRGVTVAELAIEDDTAYKGEEGAGDKEIAKNYRKRADAMYKEVVNLRRRADDMDPPVTAKKASTKAKTDA